MSFLDDRKFSWNPAYLIFIFAFILYYVLYYTGSLPDPWDFPLNRYLLLLNSTPYEDLVKKYENLLSIPISLRYSIANFCSLSAWLYLFVFSICTLSIPFLIYYHYHYAETPPGPWGLPVVGYMPFFSRTPYKDFTKFSKKYGDVFSVRIGTRNVVVINDYETIKEASMKEAFSGKPVDGRAANLGDFRSVFVTDGPLWRDQRRFLLNSMRDFGFGKQQMEDNVCEEAKQMIEEFYKTHGQPVEIRDIIYYAVTNIIVYLLFGHKFRYDEKYIINFLKFTSQVVPEQSHFSLYDAFPKLEQILPLSLFGMDTFAKMKKEVYRFFDSKIEEHKKTFDANNIRDIIDVYLMKLENMKTNIQVPETNIFTNDYIRANIFLLFLAGTETTSATLSWGLKLLALNPKIQIRVQKEIDCVIGFERMPKMSDKLKMPFTEATILEIERFISHLPLTFYHRTTENTTLKGFKIPKDTFILFNHWNVHNDPNIWKNPSEFNPERFLDSEGRISKLRDYVIPFSLGKRSCLGESLAKLEIFIYLTSFLQKLTYQVKEDKSFNTRTEIPTRNLKSCLLSVIPRN